MSLPSKKAGSFVDWIGDTTGLTRYVVNKRTQSAIQERKERQQNKYIKYISEHPEKYKPSDIQPSNKDDSPGLTLPGTLYVGPGNGLNRGHPITIDDIHAKEHDIAYSSAKTQEDIRKADEKFLSQTLTHINHILFDKGDIRDLPTAAIAGGGIGAKYLYEKLTNKVVYPSLPGKPCRHYLVLKHLMRIIILEIQHIFYKCINNVPIYFIQKNV